MPKKSCCCNICEWCNRDDSRQDNYREVTGTLTTEVPSVGHPLVNSAITGQAYYDYILQKSYLRTPAPPISEWNREIWGPGNAYGDVQPCWFNGINMKNPTEDGPFHKFKYVLHIKKKVVSENTIDYVDVVKIAWNGNGKNIRPHPDACGSYNLTSPLFLTADNGCGVFGQPNELGNSPCVMDFAKMPRGPWPYRLKRNLIPDGNNEHCYYTDDEGNKIIFNKDEADAYNKTVPTNLQCTFIQNSCQFTHDYSPFFQCCNDAYCSGSEFCNGLDDEGTPYGWEDCPTQCSGFSIYNKSPNLIGNRRFFCWWNPHNRYTTPEWDVKDTATQNTRKLSIHVIVPTVKHGVDFCTMEEPDQSFGEWAFGMDLEAPEEIAALEQSGFIFSNGREKQGVWIQKTPTNALRVLFTLDHADLEPGKVWRVFNDWNVKTDDIEWDQNAGSSNEFTVQVEQILEELAFSSLGCDCPSGGITQGPQACEYPVVDYSYENCIGKPKISFAERGPLAIRFYADTQKSGPAPTCDDLNSNSCDNAIGTETCSGHGTIMIVDAGVAPTIDHFSYYPSYQTDLFGIPYLGNKMADIPGTKAASGFGIDFNRYRNLYTPVILAGDPNFLELGGNKDLYGSYDCSSLDWGCNPIQYDDIYGYAPVKLDRIPTEAYLPACSIFFRHCLFTNYCPGDVTTPDTPECLPNIVTEQNRPSNADPDEHCNFSVCRANGQILPFCYPDPKFFGIDSDNIWFQANANEGSAGYKGDISCYHSEYKPGCGVDPNCICTNGFDGMKFRIDGGLAYGAGFPSTTIKWRKYYCQKYASYRDSESRNISELPVDMMGNLLIECDIEKNKSCDPSTDFCPCSSFWKYTCEIETFFSFPDIYNCGNWKVYTEKYDDLVTDSKFGYYDTNYKTNGGVNQDKRRSGNVLTITQRKIIT
jgi:hypothetical protein